jgi:hypothetical protein
MYKIVKKIVLCVGLLTTSLLVKGQFGDDTLQTSNLKVISTLKLGDKYIRHTTDNNDTAATKEYVDDKLSGMESGAVITYPEAGRVPFVETTGSQDLATSSGFKYTASTTPGAGYLFSGDRTVSGTSNYFGFNGNFKSSIGIFGTASNEIYIGTSSSAPGLYNFTGGAAGSLKILGISGGIYAWCNAYSSDPFVFNTTPIYNPTHNTFTFKRQPVGAFITTTDLFDIFEDTLNTLGSTAMYLRIRDSKGTKFSVNKNYTTVNNTLIANSNQTIAGNLTINGNITLVGSATGNFGVGSGGTGGGDAYISGIPTARNLAVFTNDSTIKGTSRIIDTATNLGIGTSALQSLTSGFYNTSYGYNNLKNITSGYANSSFGCSALVYNYGNNNSAFGNYSLFNNTSGYGNISVGVNSLYSNTVGAYNIAIGNSSLYYNTTGEENCAIGYIALGSNINGCGNAAVGTGVLYNSTVGNYNTGFGSATLYSLTSGSSNLALGYGAAYNITTASNWIILNTIAKNSWAEDTTLSPIAVHQSSTTANQQLYLNGNVRVDRNFKLPYLATGSNRTLMLDATGNVYTGTGVVGGGNIVSISTDAAGYIPFYAKDDTLESVSTFKYNKSTNKFSAINIESSNLISTGNIYVGTSSSPTPSYVGGYDQALKVSRRSLNQATTTISASVFEVTNESSGTSNTTGPVFFIDDKPTSTGTKAYRLLQADIDDATMISFYPRVADITNAVAYSFNTVNNLTLNGRVFEIKNNNIDKFTVKNDTVIAHKCFKSIDSLYLPYARSGAERWIGLSRQGALFSDSLVNAGFMLKMDIPTIKEHLEDQENGEISWYYKDVNGDINKSYGIAGIGRITYQVQALMSAQEQSFRYINELEDRIAKLEKLLSVEPEKYIKKKHKLSLKNLFRKN